jgi:hypothetical protein
LTHVQSVWLTTTRLSFRHSLSPHSRRIQPLVILLCFPNWNWNWRNKVLKQCLTQMEWQAVLDSIKENDFHCGLEDREKWVDRCLRSQGDCFWVRWKSKFSKLSCHFFFLAESGSFRIEPRIMRWGINNVLIRVFNVNSNINYVCVLEWLHNW